MIFQVLKKQQFTSPDWRDSHAYEKFWEACCCICNNADKFLVCISCSRQDMVNLSCVSLWSSFTASVVTGYGSCHVTKGYKPRILVSFRVLMTKLHYF